jgi:hypothetical protein
VIHRAHRMTVTDVMERHMYTQEGGVAQ